MHRFFILFIFAFVFVVSRACVFSQEATAGLSSPATAVGHPVEIVVTVRDARSAEVPQSLGVAGLTIELMGRSTRFEMNNFKISSSLTYTYSVMPQQPGEFDIPPFQIRVGDKVLKTNPLRLSVADASAFQPQQGLPGTSAPQIPAQPGQAPSNNGVPYFGELVLSKKKAYVGEVIPAELRFYFNSSIGGEVGDRPNLVGEGFTIQKPVNVPKRMQIVNGQNYTVFAFQTAITPAKSGTLEIPPARLEARLQLPGSAPAGLDDFFRQFGGVAPPGMFTNMQEVAIETAKTSLEILPLPKEGRPEDFSGAIGKFKMEASVSPKKVGPGDPVTLRINLSGQGNFDAMGAPTLVGDEGWRSYPPSEKFHSTDSINYVGEKIYEFLLVARADQQQTPGVKFPFFDPDTGKYDVLTLNPLPVQARAGQSASPSPDASSEKKKTDAPRPAASSSPVATAVRAGGATNWSSLLTRPGFLVVNCMLAVFWIFSLIGIWIRNRAMSPSGVRRKQIQTLKAHLASMESCPENEFPIRAMECLLIGLDTASNPLAAADRINALSIDEVAKAALVKLLSLVEESKFSSGGAKAPDRETRIQIISALKNLVL